MSGNFKIRAKYAKKFNLKPLVNTTAEKQYNPNGSRADILQQAYNCWQSLDYWRSDCKKNEMFVDGDQWGDYTHFYDYDSNSWKNISERAALIKQGCIPMTNNVLISILRSIIGIFISNQTEPIAISRTKDKQEAGEIMTATLQYVYQNNKLWDLDRDGLKEFFTHGVKMGKLNYCRREKHKKDVYFFDIQYDRLFFDNSMEDKRNWDCNIIGAFYDMALVDVIATFSMANTAKAETIKRIYGNRTAADETIIYDNSTRENAGDEKQFFVPSGAHAGKCRVFDIWRKERKERVMAHDYKNATLDKYELSALPAIEAENQRRIREISEDVISEVAAMHFESEEQRKEQIKSLIQEYSNIYLITTERFFDSFWVNYCLTPDGYVLYQEEFPFCPVVLKRDLGADGKIHAYVSYFIEQQKSINRNRSVQDDINRRSIKGVTAYDENTLGDNTKPEIEAGLSKPGAILFYNSQKGGNPPTFHNATSQNTGALQLMQSDLAMIEKISGSTDAIQGLAPKSGTPAALYMQQTQNSVGVLSYILDSYREYREDRDRLIVKMIQEYYDEEMYVNIHSSKELKLFSPRNVQDVDFEISIIESQQTPTFRMIQDNLLQQWVQMGLIPLEVALQAGSFAFKDNLMQLLEEYKNRQAQQQPSMQPGNIPQQ
ncbi:MAG: hypothetical protein LBH19_05510 [Dysgonamonadaceae bacterium]|jgi:hypothetical protein|nr:hypothetical protein [Dysgonamonadaceae bacterium]